MKLPTLIDLCLLLILASVTKGEDWAVDVNRYIKTTVGANVTILCTFTHPKKLQVQDVYWKKKGNNIIAIKDLDQNPNIYHSDSMLVLEKYREKTKFIGDIAKKNCSLVIYDIQDNEPNIYVRLILNTTQYSFKNHFVSISLEGHELVTPGVIADTSDIITSPSTTTETNTSGVENLKSASTYIAIFVPVAVLGITIFVAGIIYCIKHKRSKSLTREDSGYYANFSRTSSNQAKRETFCKKQENTILPEPKAIDDPTYVNIKAPPEQMDQHMDNTDNIYANVDHLK